MRQPFRLLVTGSRTWDDVPAIERALAVVLARHPEGVLLVHGAGPAPADCRP
jgi:YspA, cpYpsA-related SLOG family